jgi:hypothetical protein
VVDVCDQGLCVNRVRIYLLFAQLGCGVIDTAALGLFVPSDFFSLYLCMGGIVLLVGAMYAFDFKLNHWRLLLLDAIIHLVIGPAFLVSFGFGFSFSFIAVLFGLHAAALGILYGVTAIRAGKSERASYILGLAATVSLLAGAYMIIGRSWAPDRLLLTASLYMVIFGLLLLLLSIGLRTTHHPKLA